MLMNALISRAAQTPSAFDTCPFTSWPRPGMKKENNAGAPCVFFVARKFTLPSFRKYVENLLTDCWLPKIFVTLINLFIY